MASNSWQHVTDWYAMESLNELLNKLAVSQFFDKSYNSEFKLKHPVGDTIRVPFPDRPGIRNGLDYNPEAIDRRYATIEMFEPFGSDWEMDSVEKALKAPRGEAKVRKEIIQPRMSKLAQEIDSRCALWAYQNAALVVGSLGTNPTTYDATSAAARQLMAEAACPDDGRERAMIVPPAVHRSIKTSNLALFNPVSDISKQFRTGLVGSADGFEWYESMSLYRHTAGTWAGAVTVASAPATGATTLSLTCTTGDTFKKGDKISIANVLPVNPMTKRTYGTSAKVFTITADATGASSAATVSIYPAIEGPTSRYQNVDALPVATAALTLWPGTASPSAKVGNVGIAIHPGAFGLVSVDLELPDAVEDAKVVRDPESGISIAFVRFFDGRSRKMCNRYDVQIGLGTFYGDSCAVAVACG